MSQRKETKLEIETQEEEDCIVHLVLSPRFLAISSCCSFLCLSCERPSVRVLQERERERKKDRNPKPAESNELDR